MRNRWIWPVASAVLLGACSTDMNGTSQEPETVPDAVIALAAPDQNIETARLRPEDGCYWYEHSGPVETTLVPLRSPAGNPICAARES